MKYVSKRIGAALLVGALIGSAGLSCKKPEDRRGAPPPPDPSPSASAGACAHGGGTISDSATSAFFPRVFDDYCLDPHGQSRSYGTGTDRNIDEICLEAFNGDCETYKSFGLDRVVLVRYVSNHGNAATIDAVVSKYTSADGAYGMFTQRVISEADPARKEAPKPMQIHATGALGTGIAYLVKGQLVVELTYTNVEQTPQQLQASADELLPKLSKLIAEKIPGNADAPIAVQKLPTENLIPLGIFFQPKDAFEVEGAGAGAQGYYAENGKRFRVISITRSDPEQAKDVLSSIAKKPGAQRLKDIADGAVRVMIGDDDNTKTEWIVGRLGNQLIGVGDEAAMMMDPANVKPEQVNLSKEEKIKRIRALLTPQAAPQSAPPNTPTGAGN